MDSSSPENLFGDRNKVLQGLIQGRESANQLRLILGKPLGDDKSSVAVDDLVTKILGSFTESISILNWRPIEEEVFDKIPENTGGNSPSSNGRKYDESEESSKSTSAFKERRGCYKRRKSIQTLTKITPNLIDDGHAWRKYGQKVILNAKHPRNYYRCTHKFDQGCQATKQVQKNEEDPPMYQTTYNGNHTCHNLHKPPHIILDSTIPRDSSNSVFLSFGSTNYPNSKSNDHEPNYPLVKQEYFQTQEPMKPSFNHNQSTATDHLFMLSDFTTFDTSEPMPVLSSESDHGGDVISSSGVYSCTASTHDDSHSFDLDMMTVGDFDDVLQEFNFHN